MKISEIIFNGLREQNKLEDDLFNLGIIFQDTSYDDYDNSIELFDVQNDLRLSEEAQKLLFDAGFSTVFLNHLDKWETHYTFRTKEFELVEGWRVSYPQKRGRDEKGIWVEKKVDSWPSGWFETGYAIVKGKQNG